MSCCCCWIKTLSFWMRQIVNDFWLCATKKSNRNGKSCGTCRYKNEILLHLFFLGRNTIRWMSKLFVSELLGDGNRLLLLLVCGWGGGWPYPAAAVQPMACDEWKRTKLATNPWRNFSSPVDSVEASSLSAHIQSKSFFRACSIRHRGSFFFEKQNVIPLCVCVSSVFWGSPLFPATKEKGKTIRKTRNDKKAIWANYRGGNGRTRMLREMSSSSYLIDGVVLV